MSQEISNQDLRANEIPRANASHSEILKFLHTFIGYKFYTFEGCGELADQDLHKWQDEQTLPPKLPKLSVCMFFVAQC